MPNIKLTKKYVLELPYTSKGQILHWDSELHGFGLCVGTKSKTFIVQKKIHGKAVRCTIGKIPVFSVEQARERASDILRDMAKGINPNEEKAKAKIKGITLKELYNHYYNDAKHRLSPRTLVGYGDYMDNQFPDWKSTPIAEITKEMIIQRHKKITEDSGKVAANNALQFMRAMYNYAAIDDEGLQNPVDILSRKKLWHPKERRQTIIKEHKLADWYAAVMQLENESIKDALVFLLFTGLRKMEAFTLRWDHVDLKGKTFRIEHTKNKQPLELPLSDFLHAMLTRRYATKDSSGYVFTGASKDGNLVEPKKAIKAITEASGVSFMLHDLRRTFITTAERLDISSYALKRLVNHKSGSDVTAGYIIMDAERLREPMERIASQFNKLCN
jgi:integrase